jgi:hypothetical protein
LRIARLCSLTLRDFELSLALTLACSVEFRPPFALMPAVQLPLALALDLS